MTKIMILAATVCLLFGCGVSKTVKKVKRAVTPDDVVEKIAAGDVAGLVAISFRVMNAMQDFVVVHQDETCVIAEVRKIPGLGISLPGGDSRYYIRIDNRTLTAASSGGSGSTTMVFSFFKSAVGTFREVMKPDSLVGKYAQQLFLHIFAALLKAGVVFK